MRPYDLHDSSPPEVTVTLAEPAALDSFAGLIGSALRLVARSLPEGGQQTARRNAADAVLADQARAQARAEAANALAALPAPRRAAAAG